FIQNFSLHFATILTKQDKDPNDEQGLHAATKLLKAFIFAYAGKPSEEVTPLLNDALTQEKEQSQPLTRGLVHHLNGEFLLANDKLDDAIASYLTAAEKGFDYFSYMSINKHIEFDNILAGI